MFSWYFCDINMGLVLHACWREHCIKNSTCLNTACVFLDSTIDFWASVLETILTPNYMVSLGNKFWSGRNHFYIYALLFLHIPLDIQTLFLGLCDSSVIL